jgi:hypothetical protein
MYWHGPTCLKGPISRSNAWWAPGAPPLREGIRVDLVERVRREIAAGTYDTPAKWEAALDRLYERLIISNQ